MANTKGNTADKVMKIAEPIAKELGLEIWDIRYLKEGVSWFLRIFIDSENGINIDDCENFSRAIDKPLDDADFIKEAYYLEVSSPGLGRTLSRPEHFEKMMGEEIKIKLIRPIDKIKEFEGMLKFADSEKVVIATDDKELSFLKADISKVCLNDDKDI